jgi:DNA-binding transcriptional MocR family regulator
MDDITVALSSRARRRAPSPIRELMPYLSVPGMISLGGGYPNPDTFAFRRVEIALVGGGPTLLLEGAALNAATQYGPTDALPGLREPLCGWHYHKDGVPLSDGELLLLNGSQEGLYLAADVLLDEGDEVAVCEPTYQGALAAFRSFTDRFLAIPLDGEGMCVAELDRVLAERQARKLAMPKLVYCIPSGHNPAGVTLTEPRRRHLAELAVRHGLLILEDDPYQLLQLDPGAPRLPTLQSLAPSRVLRLDSFSKILCPGLRLGYASGPASLIRAMNLHKQASNLHTSTFAQAILDVLLRAEGGEGLGARIERAVALYRRNRDAMVEAAGWHLPPGVSLRVPGAGMFLWFTLPEGCDATRMVTEDARKLKVVLVPGGAFSTQGGLRNAMRASYSMVTPEQIDEGMRRFGVMVEREVARGAK